MFLSDGSCLELRVFKHAERLGAGKLIIIGDKEVESGIVKVKDLATQVEEEVALDAIASVWSK